MGSVCHRVTAPKAVPTGLDLRHEFVVGLQQGELCVSCFKLSRLYKKKRVLEGAFLIASSWCFLIRHLKYFTMKPFYLLESVFPFASLLLISTLLQKPFCTSAEVPCWFVLLHTASSVPAGSVGSEFLPFVWSCEQERLSSSRRSRMAPAVPLRTKPVPAERSETW